MGETRPPGFGEMARGFIVATDEAYDFSFDVAAGRRSVLMIFGSRSRPPSLPQLRSVMRLISPSRSVRNVAPRRLARSPDGMPGRSLEGMPSQSISSATRSS